MKQSKPQKPKSKVEQLQEQLDKAIDSYKKLIELQPDNRDNYVNIAIIYQKLDQLSVARSYLVKAQNVDPSWDYPIYIEAQLYEQSARNCIRGQFEFIDKCVYKLAVDTYAKARAKGGLFADRAGSRISQLSNSIPSKEDYFFQQLSNGDEIKIQGKFQLLLSEFLENIPAFMLFEIENDVTISFELYFDE